MSTTNVGGVVVTFGANTAKFTVDLDRANEKLKQTGQSFEGTLRKLGSAGKKMGQDVASGSHQAVTAMQATSAGLRLGEGGLNNILRAAERFTSTIPGVGAAFQAAFPVVGAIAVLGILSRMYDKVGEVRAAIQAMNDAPKAMATAWRAVNAPLQQTTDELAKTNDTLRNDIAKLEGKPQNGLALALDDARIFADKLEESLTKDLDAVQKLMAAQSVSTWQKLLGHGGTDDITSEASKFQDKINGLTFSGNQNVHSATTKSAADAARNGLAAQLKSAFAAEISKAQGMLSEANRIQGNRHLLDTPWAGSGLSYTDYQSRSFEARKAGDQAVRQQDLQAYIRNLYLQSDQVGAMNDNATLTGTKNALRATSGGKSDPYGNAIRELMGQQTTAKAGLSAASDALKAPDDKLTPAMVKGFGEAQKVIASTNAELAKTHQRLSLSQTLNITGLADSIALLNAETEAKKKQADVDKAMAAFNDQATEEIAKGTAKHADEIAQINAEILATERLTAARLTGSAADVAAAELALKSVGRKGDLDTNAANDKLAESQKAAGIAETVRQLNLETAATQRLTAAANLGRDAQRQAQIANALASAKSPAEGAAKVANMQSAFGLSDAQTMKTGSASDGVTRYFSEMRDNVESTAKSVHDVLGGAFNGLNDTLARLVDGQKVSWASFFSGIASQIATIGLKNLEGLAFGGLAGGQQQKQGGGFSGFLSSVLSFLPHFAAGGDVSGGPILVGENGPEVWNPPGPGRITPNNKLGGSVAYYTINAQGANAADMEARVNRSLVAVHGNAVKNSVAVQREVRARSPRSKFA